MKRWLYYLALAVGMAGMLGTASVAGARPGAKPAAQGAAVDNSDYVGADTCKTCHEEIYNSWEKTPHWKTTLDTKGGPSHQGLRGVPWSGGGARGRRRRRHKNLHLQGRFGQRNQRPLPDLPCGRPAAHEHHQFRARQGRRELHLLPFAAPRRRLRNSCWSKPSRSCAMAATSQQKAQFDMPFHHRVNEGLIQCSDCHNVHGTAGPKQVRTSATPGCGLLQMPHRQAGTLCLRARPDQGRRLRFLPQRSRRAERAHAESQQRQSALPADATRSPASAARRALLRSITRPASFNRARCATWRFTAPTSIRPSLNRGRTELHFNL